MRPAVVVPLAAFLLSGCLASKGDVALLQSELHGIRDANQQADATQRARVDLLVSMIQRSLDSVRVVSQRLAKLQGDVQNDHYEMGRQILTIQELTGQSQRRIQELRASLEERNQQPALAPAVPGDTTRPAPGGPGPAQLFQSSLDQLRRGSTTVARSGFEELVRNYPTSDDAPEAMIYIAATYAAERNQAAADSVYGLVVQKYPSSPKAATALYKRALSLRAAGQSAAARGLLDRIVKEYPRSDEAELAREQLRKPR
ncbi:MAG TPA: tetratricopeptide repeat protein [Gemmatimonadaceae bacterium]